MTRNLDRLAAMAAAVADSMEGSFTGPSVSTRPEEQKNFGAEPQAIPGIVLKSKKGKGRRKSVTLNVRVTEELYQRLEKAKDVGEYETTSEILTDILEQILPPVESTEIFVEKEASTCNNAQNQIHACRLCQCPQCRYNRRGTLEGPSKHVMEYSGK